MRFETAPGEQAQMDLRGEGRTEVHLLLANNLKTWFTGRRRLIGCWLCGLASGESVPRHRRPGTWPAMAAPAACSRNDRPATLIDKGFVH